jgi:ABC-type dipeptide/oligopeptide/nickel transport system ATPase component
MKSEINKENHALLTIRGLKTEFRLKDGNVLHAVDGIDLTIKPGEIHGLVGESGCGKTVASLSILRLISRPGLISGGEAQWNGSDLLKLKNQEMRHIRGKEIAMIFQNPQAALNPLYKWGHVPACDNRHGIVLPTKAIDRR